MGRCAQTAQPASKRPVCGSSVSWGESRSRTCWWLRRAVLGPASVRPRSTGPACSSRSRPRPAVLPCSASEHCHPNTGPWLPGRGLELLQRTSSVLGAFPARLPVQLCVSWRCALHRSPCCPWASLSLWTRPRGTRILKSQGRLFSVVPQSSSGVRAHGVTGDAGVIRLPLCFSTKL